VVSPVPKPSAKRGKPDLEAAKREVSKGPLIQWSEMSVSKLPLTKIEHGNNPRVVVDAEQNRELAESVKQHGVLQPIRIRRIDSDRYQIIAGHRRYEAAKTAGLVEIPIIIAEAVDEQTAYIQSLVENLQRKDLDPIDEAKAFKALLETTGDTQTQLGKRIGRSQSQISNSIALLNLKPEVQRELSAGNLTVGHAKVLAYMPPEKQAELARQAVDRKLTVRDVEAISAQQKAAESTERQRREQASADAKAILELLSAANAPGKDIVIALYSEALVSAVRDAGWTNARVVNWKTDTTYPTYECECQAFWLPGGQTISLRKMCVNKTHERSVKAKAVAAAKVAERDAENLLDRTRRAAVNGLKAKDADVVTEDGIRIGLYGALMREDQFGNNAERSRAAFVKRHGGTWPDYSSGGEGSLAVWEAVEGLNSSDLVDEYLMAVVNFVMPNVYTSSQFANREHFAVRQWAADRLGLDKSIVWGGKEPWDRTPVKRPEVSLGVEVQVAVVEEPVVEVLVEKLTMAEALAEAGLMNPIAADLVAIKRAERVTQKEVEEVTTEVVTERSPLEGEYVVVTGVVQDYPRSEVAGLVSRLGGMFTETVNSKTTLLVVGDKPGKAKLDAAAKYGVKTMTEADLRKLAGG
jgi:ParB/RepB/Spo0J family partition protein